MERCPEAPCGISWPSVVRLDKHAIHLHVAGGHFESRRQAIKEAFDDGDAIHTDHAIVGDRTCRRR